jgi:hypothetical protein
MISQLVWLLEVYLVGFRLATAEHYARELRTRPCFLPTGLFSSFPDARMHHACTWEEAQFKLLTSSQLPRTIFGMNRFAVPLCASGTPYLASQLAVLLLNTSSQYCFYTPRTEKVSS